MTHCFQVIGVMYFPDRSARGDQLTGADSGLDKILAEFQTSPSCNFDEHILPPDSFLQSSGFIAGPQTSYAHDLLGPSMSLPSDRRFEQELLAASRSAPPLVTIPQTSGLDGFMLQQQQQQQPHPPEALLQPDNISGLLPQRSRGSSEDDIGPCHTEPGGQVKRQKRLAEKNRTAQKRYRERQKEKMHDFERQVEQLSEQVTMLMREKATLETRNSLLERVVQLKDEQQQSDGYEGGVWNTQQLALRRAIAEFHNIVHIRDPPITSQHVDILDQTFILQLYNAYANELMQCMLSANADDKSSAGFKRMEQLVRGHQNTVLHLTRQDPKQLNEMVRELKKRQPPNPQEMWHKCVDAMKLDREQRLSLVGLRNELFERMASIIEQRRCIISHLEASMSTPLSVCAGPNHHETFSKALQASDELKESLELEHKEVSQVVSAFHASDILTPLQIARATIEAYPYMKDVFGIMEVVAAEEGEQSEGSFIASLMGQRNNGSLMPADSAFRMVSSVPPPLRTTSASHNSSDFQDQEPSSDQPRKFSSASN
ncbi:g4089 [Coccomyxa elongata]